MIDEDHVLVGTPSGCFETMDGAKSWTHVKQTQGWGVANSFANGTINGNKYILIGANAGLGNVPLKRSPLVLTSRGSDVGFIRSTTGASVTDILLAALTRCVGGAGVWSGPGPSVLRITLELKLVLLLRLFLNNSWNTTQKVK